MKFKNNQVRIKIIIRHYNMTIASGMQWVVVTDKKWYGLFRHNSQLSEHVIKLVKIIYI